MRFRWPWGGPQTQEPADDIAARLEEVVSDLEEASSDLRSLVAGLRAVGSLSPTIAKERTS